MIKSLKIICDIILNFRKEYIELPRIRSRFMFNYRIKHPTIVFEDFGTEYGYISLTHSKVTSGKKNIPLPENPDKGDSAKAYILPNPRKDKKKSFSPYKKKMTIGKKNKYWVNKVKNRPYK